jgi:two-component system sensor histidine kinase HydH
LNKEKINIGDLVASSLKLVSSDAQALEVKIILEIEPDIPDIDLDRDKINQVLLNLYLNGLQAMEISDLEKELKISVLSDTAKGTVTIEVKDNGKGIPQENIDKILDPYFTTKPDGTGLGLALAYKIIDEHSGTIQFKSLQGHGTTVSVTFPMR